MKVLVLAHRYPDFLLDGVVHGLVALLGTDNVVVYPPKERYHEEPAETAWAPMLYLRLPRREEAELEDLVADADGVVLGLPAPEVRAAARSVLARPARPPVAFVDGADDPFVRGAIAHVDVYFKRELPLRPPLLTLGMPLRRRYHALRYRDAWQEPLARQVRIASARDRDLVPLPFGLIDTGFAPAGEREYDVAFLGGPTSDGRADLLRDLEALAREGYRVAVPGAGGARLSWREYMEVLARSRIGIAVRGAGWDTYRYWEVPSAGALLLSERPGIPIPRNFVDGVEAVFAPPGELIATARRLLGSGLDEIAARGRTALLERHTSVNRARTVLDHLDRARRRRARAAARAAGGRAAGRASGA
jgi:hypothetical protein